MIAFFETMISFVAVIALCVFCIRAFRLTSGLAPIAVLSATMLYFTVAGCFNVLEGAGYVYFGISLAALIYLGITAKRKCTERVITPSFILFVALGAVLLAYFALRQPLLYDWDEYSFWGTAARLVANSNELYSTVEFGWPWAATQKPGLVLLSYVFNFFGEFAPWRLYFAYDLLLFAIAAAVIGSLPIKKWHIAIPVSLIALLLPFIVVYLRMIYFTTTYASSYADIPMGLLMGGALAVYYHIVSTHKYKELWVLGAILGAVTMCKDTGLPLAFIAAGVMTVDIIFCQKNRDFVMGKLKGVWAKAAVCTSFFAVPLAGFIGWSKYLGSTGIPQDNLGGESSLTSAGLLVNGIKLLFGINNTDITRQYTDKFADVLSSMVDNFLHNRMCMFGTGLTTFMVFAVLIACIAIFTRDRIMRRRTVLYGVFMSLGFCAYYAFIGFTYVFIFKADGADLPDYNRYMGSYYAAMMAAAFALLAIAAASGSKYYDILTLVCILAASGVLFLFTIFVPKHLSVINYPSVIYHDSLVLEKQSDIIKDTINDDDARIFLVSQDDNGKNWFEFSYALLPNILDYSWGGGRLSSPLVYPSEDNPLAVSAEQLAAYLVDSKCSYVLIHSIDEYFVDSYQELFSTELSENEEQVLLYKLEIKSGYEIVERNNANGETLRGGSDLVNKDKIRIMPNAKDFLQLVPVEMEGMYE